MVNQFMDPNRMDFIQEAVASIRQAQDAQQSGRGSDFRDSNIQAAIALALVDIAKSLRGLAPTTHFVQVFFVQSGGLFIGLKTDGTIWSAPNAFPMVWTQVS